VFGFSSALGGLLFLQDKTSTSTNRWQSQVGWKVVYLVAVFTLLNYIYIFPHFEAYGDGLQTSSPKGAMREPLYDEGFHPQSISGFLQSQGVGPDRTLFVAMATESYIEPMVNFKWGLDKFELGGDYVVLCLDVPCLEAAHRYNILAFRGFVGKSLEGAVDWHSRLGSRVAEIKVSFFFLSLFPQLFFCFFLSFFFFYS